MDFGSFLSLELATIGLVTTIVAAFLRSEYKLNNIKKAIDDLKENDKSITEIAQEITRTLAKSNADHDKMFERFASSTRRAEKMITVLDKISDQIDKRGTQLALLTKDHENLMKVFESSIERLVEKVEFGNKNV